MKRVLPALVCLCVCSGFAQQEDRAPPPADAKPAETSPAPPPRWSFKGLDFYGLFDAYASDNTNHPVSGRNEARAFDLTSNGVDLSFAKLAIEHLPDPVGFRVEAGVGRALDVIHSLSNTEPDPMRHILQAYVSLKPKQAGGLEVDFGKFSTSAGAEVNDTQANWNYSRSLLFAVGPYYHFGLRTTMPFGKHFVGGVQVVQGINNIVDNNSGKTFGFTGAWTYSKVTLAANYYVGPEKNNTTQGWRNYVDTVLTVTPTSKTAFYLNYDVNTEKNIGPGRVSYNGIAAAARFSLTKRVAIAPRIEWLSDPNGFATLTGVGQTIREATITGEYKWMEGVLTRLEFRHDSSTQAFFTRDAGQPPAHTQNTVELGMIGYFGPKR